MRYPENCAALAIVLLLAAGPLAYSSTAQTSGDAVVITERVAGKDLLAGGSDVQVNAEVVQDAIVAGQSVTVNGPVGGYVMAAGRNVAVNGSVGNDVWAAGSTVTVAGEVRDGVRLAGSTVTLGPDSSVAGNARIAAGTVSIQGPIARDLFVSGGNVEIGSAIGGSVTANVGRLKVLPGAVISGDLIVKGTTPPEVSPQAQVLGQVKFEQTDTGSTWLGWLGWWVFCFLVLLATGVVLLLISKVWAARVATQINSKPLKTLLGGIIGLIVGPIIIVLLAFTAIGFVLALVLFAVYCVFAVLAAVYVSYTAGGWLLGLAKRPEASPWLRMIIGALVVSFLASLPWIGWVIQLIVLIFGFGALMLERWDLRRQLSNEGWA